MPGGWKSRVRNLAARERRRKEDRTRRDIDNEKRLDRIRWTILAIGIIAMILAFNFLSRFNF